MEKARQWLKMCIKTHPTCPKPRSDAVDIQLEDSNKPTATKPSRLIQISKQQSEKEPSLRLFQTSPDHSWEQYAALSYCWGGDQAVKLTKLNLVPWCSGISFLDLPQTIKDAVTVTIELGLCFLWVDALCIIQDDDADNVQELARMGDIYREAHVTLSAARSTKVHEGFLQSRYIPGERGFRVPFLCNDGQMGSVVLWRGREPGTREPTEARAWCLQESLLSPRVLEFGIHQVRWRCARNRKDGVQPESDGWVTDSKTYAQLGSPHVGLRWVDWDSLLEDEYKLVDTWKNIVAHYTALALGFSGDTLRAISSIAKKIGQVTHERYCAGMWTKYLPDLLLWSPYRETSSTQKIATRIPNYIAPTWSWASFHGPISHVMVNIVSFVEHHEVTCTHKIVGDEYSDVVSAQLRIRLGVRRARIGSRGRLDTSHCDQAERDELDDGVQCDLDEEDVHTDCEVLLALVSNQYGLVLKSQAEGSSPIYYTRIGLFQLFGYKNDWTKWETMDVTII